MRPNQILQSLKRTKEYILTVFIDWILAKYIKILEDIIKLGKIAKCTVYPERIYFRNDGTIIYDQISEQVIGVFDLD